MPRIGVIGSMVWDDIHGRNPLEPPREEWGGIAYALAGLDAALADDWSIVPLIKVGRDLAPRASEFINSLHHLEPGARCIEVPVANNRVTLRYQSTERRCERMQGGVPGWTWTELGPMVADLDALYVNFISGFEMCRYTAESLRRGFRGPIYADLHSLFLGMGADGMRMLQPLPNAPEWLSYFDHVQMNEEEMQQITADPLRLAADAMHAGVSLLVVTLGPRGAIYVQRPGEGLLRTELIAAPAVDAVDPTGCGDVFGSTCFARLLANDPLPVALREAAHAAARNATLHGADAALRHLRGELLTR